jgi:hypothetical protein
LETTEIETLTRPSWVPYYPKRKSSINYCWWNDLARFLIVLPSDKFERSNSLGNFLVQRVKNNTLNDGN